AAGTGAGRPVGAVEYSRWYRPALAQCLRYYVAGTAQSAAKLYQTRRHYYPPDELPGLAAAQRRTGGVQASGRLAGSATECAAGAGDRKSTRLNSSHVKISYAVFCLKKKNKKKQNKDHDTKKSYCIQ